MKLKKGDLVQVTVGKDSGRQGRIERVFLDRGAILVPGLNQYKKHRKPQGPAETGRPGEIITLDRPLAVAKVALVCPKCKQLTRIGYRVQGLEKVRICRKCNNTVDEVKTAAKKAKV